MLYVDSSLGNQECRLGVGNDQKAKPEQKPAMHSSPNWFGRRALCFQLFGPLSFQLPGPGVLFPKFGFCPSHLAGGELLLFVNGASW